MRLREVVLLTLLLPVLLFSCKKEKSNEKPVSDSISYLPQKAGSSWHYEDTAQKMGFKLVATDSTKTLEGIRFTIYRNIPDSSSLATSYTLIGRQGADYYISGLLSQLGTEKLLVLKQDGEIGDSWTQDFAYDSSLTLSLEFKILEKGISKTVNGKSYKQVFHVGLTAKIPLDNSTGTGATFSVPIGDIYFAANVGIIELDLTPPEAQGESIHLLLTDYDIP